MTAGRTVIAIAHRLATIRDSDHVSRIMQLALAFLLTNRESVAYVQELTTEIRRRHETFADQLQAHGLDFERATPPYLWISVPDETSVCSSLSADGIGVYPGAFFRIDGNPAHDPRISLNAAAVGSDIESLAHRIAEACHPPRLTRRHRP